MITRSLAAVAFISGLLVCGSTQAEPPVFYLGAAYGKTRSNVSTTQAATYTNPCLAASCSKDDSDNGYNLTGGYRLHRHLAFEVSYVKLGDTALINTTAPAADSATRQDSSGIRLMAVGLLPLDNGITLLGKAGFYHWSSDVRFSNTLGVSYSASESGTKPSIGLGVEYAINRDVSVQLTWDRYSSLGSSPGALQSGTGPVKTIDVDVDLIGFGVLYRIR